MINPKRFARSALALALAFIVAAATVSFVPGAAGAAGSGNEATLVTSDTGGLSLFLRNQFTEVGARANGSFGSAVPQPVGWHGNFNAGSAGSLVGPDGLTSSGDRPGVGFRTDRDKDGWGVGRDDGDFFTPGIPYEGWAVQTSGATFWNIHNATNVVGQYVSTDTAGDPSGVWDSADDRSGVAVRLVQSVPSNGDQQLNVDVTFTNPAGTAVDAYYRQGVDPDNCQQYVESAEAVCSRFNYGVPEVGGTYRTLNTVQAQRRSGGAVSAVSATQTDGSNLVLWTSEPDSLATHFNSASGFPGFCEQGSNAGIYDVGTGSSIASPTEVQCGPNGRSRAFTEVGASNFADQAMALVVKKSVPGNGSVTFRVSYSFSTAAYENAVTPTALVDLTEGPLDTMTANTPYTFDLSATGIAVPTYTVTAGTVPDGLTLDPVTGSISGTPTTAGTYDFSVTASGTEGSVTKQYTGSILAAPGVAPTWSSNTLPDLVKGRPYSSAVTATATGNAPGIGAITYEILGDASTLPDGLTLNPTTGAVTGTPTGSGPYSFTIAATNEFGFVTQQFTGVVGVPPTWTDNVLAGPTRKWSYSDGVAAAGSGPIRYAVTSGRLPAGLSLDSATGAVTGRATDTGIAEFTVTASSVYGSVAQAFRMVVAATPRASESGTVFFLGRTTTPTADGRRVLARLAAAAPGGAQDVRVEVQGWAEFRRGPLPVVEQLAARRETYVTAELRGRGVDGAYSGRPGGRYPIPGATGRRAEVIVSWDIVK